MSVRSYGLDWIDEDALFEVTKHAFRNAIQKVNAIKLQAPPDPFTIAAQAVFFGQDSETMMAFEKLRSVNKSISNAVGNWHQAVLGLADGWENLGTNGGGVDLMVATPDGKHAIAVEVKNRYNTIKAVDEKKTWDNLDLLARTNGTNSSIVQIVPASPQRYDRPWKVSGREERKNIRCCDGATAYTWAFGCEHALKEIYQAFPSILGEAIGAKGSSPFKSDDMLMWYSISLPE